MSPHPPWVREAFRPLNPSNPYRMKFIDLFCGIGGFHLAAQKVAAERGIPLTCVLSSDIDPDAQTAYEANFGTRPLGDIRTLAAEDVPDHDLLFAGFPCQPFSIAGLRGGFTDDRGTLFFEIKRILEAKRPKAFVLENVKQLRGHDGGKTLKHILKVLQNDLGYHVDWEVLNALDFGLPQKRERILIVGFREKRNFDWPLGGLPMKPLNEILEENVPDFYLASERIKAARAAHHQKGDEPTIWHENKSGNVSKYPYSCALRAGASYNYLLVDGERRLTEREMLRLQGFPDSFKIACNYGATRKQAGNAVPVPLVASVLDRVLDALEEPRFATDEQDQPQAMLAK